MSTIEFTKRTIIIAVVAVIAMIVYKTTLYEVVQIKKAYAEEQEEQKSVAEERVYQLKRDTETEKISRQRYENGKVFCKYHNICDLYKGAYPGKVKENLDRVPEYLQIKDEYDMSAYPIDF